MWSFSAAANSFEVTSSSSCVFFVARMKTIRMPVIRKINCVTFGLIQFHLWNVPLVVNILINCFSLGFTKARFCIFEWSHLNLHHLNECRLMWTNEFFLTVSFLSLSPSVHFTFGQNFHFFYHRLSKCMLNDKQVAFETIIFALKIKQIDLHFTHCSTEKCSHFFLCQ